MEEEAKHDHMCETCPEDNRQLANNYCKCEKDDDGNRCPNYGKYYCEECVIGTLHNHLPEWITTLNSDLHKKWQALHDKGIETEEKMENCYEQVEPLVSYLERVIEK